jgi:hypothetical protein
MTQEERPAGPREADTGCGGAPAGEDAESRAGRVRAFFAGIASGYETHRPVLCEAVLRTRGPILELGTGEGSTLALHAVSAACSRRVFSFDHDRGWIERFLHLRGEHHFLAHVPSWDDCPIDSQFWSVALVDHKPAERRVVEIGRLAYRAELVVVHDTDSPEYNYEAIIDSFSYRLEYREHKQWTTLLSNYVDVSGWRIGP